MYNELGASFVMGQEAFLRHAFVKIVLSQLYTLTSDGISASKPLIHQRGSFESSKHLSICDYPHINPHHKCILQLKIFEGNAVNTSKTCSS